MQNLTKKAIKTSFLELLNEQPLSKISVRTVVEACGINRNTFYYYYQDLPTLIEEIIKESIDLLIEKYPTINSLDECVDIVFKQLIKNKKAMSHIYNSVNRNIFEQYCMQLCEYLVTTYLDTAFEKGTVGETDRKIAIRFFKCELYGLLFDWISNGMKEEAVDELHHITEICRGLSSEVIERSKHIKG